MPDGYVMIGESPVMGLIKQSIKEVASADPATVLITGETGVGKELIASEIYRNSARYGKPFVRINCAALPDKLVESELFGYEKGAFTDAKSTKKGQAENADGGVLLLDEVGSIYNTETQAKFLRLLGEGVFYRVGGTEEIKTNLRIIATTNRDLKKGIEDGTFREDLYYRLNVIPFHVPPLRDRKEDIPLLAEHFLNRYIQKYGRIHKKLGQGVEQILMNYDYPGNVRELENIIQTLVVLRSDREIITTDFVYAAFHNGQGHSDSEHPAEVGIPIGSNGDGPYELAKQYGLLKASKMIEEAVIRRALAEKEGVKNQAAKLLRTNRTTLVEKMKKHSITHQ